MLLLSEAPSVWIFVAAYTPIVLVATLIFILTNLRRNPARLAAALDARWKARGVPGFDRFPPLVEFDADGTPGEAALQTLPPGTRVRLHWPSWRRLRVIPRTMGSSLRGIVGGDDVRTGDTDFDSEFRTESSDRRWAASLLDLNTRTELVALRKSSRWWSGRDVMLDLGSSGVTLRLGRNLSGNAAALGNVMALAASVLARAQALSAPDVEISPAELRAGSGCPVCGYPVEGGRSCGTCRTPHHEDCWTYSGGCAIFGCPGRRAVA